MHRISKSESRRVILCSGHNFRKFQSTSLLMLWLSNYAVIFCLVLWDNDKPLYDSYSSSCQCQYIISLIWTPCHNTKVDFPWSTFLIQCIMPWLRSPLWRLSKKERKLQYILASAPHDEKIFVYFLFQIEHSFQFSDKIKNKCLKYISLKTIFQHLERDAGWGDHE